MKRILIGLLFIICHLSLSSVAAQSVSRQQAQQTAQQFMAKRGMTLSQKNIHKATRQQQAANDDNAYYYVFNATDNQGFVIVSGDERAVPVLGYADSGTFNEENLPDGMEWLLENYRNQMNALDKAPSTLHTSPSTQIYHAPRQTRHAVAPLMTTLWNQGNPYNILCPRYFNDDATIGEHSATGCVATAMAQVVAYYRWPEKLKRGIPGYIQTYNTSEGEKKERRNTIPAGTVIDWDNMLDNYNGEHTAQQDTAVALLMYMVGVDCKMSYGASSASGYSEGVDGLITSFDFDDGTHIEKRDWYTLHAWDEMIYNEIASGHPVPYGGQNSGGGHAFVLDGYDIDGLYHVNWGWGGMSNGYFRIDILDPDNHEGIGASQTPGGYNMGQDCIIGMKRPDGIKDTPPSRHRLSANDWEIRGGNKFFANYVNWTGITANWNMGIGYVNDEGELTVIGSYATTQISPNYYSSQEFSVQGLKEGVYRIVPISKRSTDTKWVCHVCPDRNYVYTEVNANGQVVKMEIRPTEDFIEITNFSFPGNHKRGDDQTVSASFRNNGEDEYFKEIHLLASRTQQKGEAFCRTAIAIAHGEETSISLKFKPEQSGTWNVWLATDKYGNNVVGRSTIEITDAGIIPQHNLRYASHTVTNRSNNIVYGNQMQGKVSILNQDDKTFDGLVKLWLFKQGDDGYFYSAQSMMVPVVIEPKMTASASYSFRNLDLNAQYNMSILYAEGGDIQDGGLKNMGRTQAGILYWNQSKQLSGMALSNKVNTPSGAIAISFSGLGSRVQNIEPNANPNTLYVFDTGATVPETLQGHNVVCGTRAEEIVLNDNYAYFSPVTFTASKASFTRNTPATGWEPLALPFTAATLPSGILVHEFSRQDDDDIIFTRAFNIQANIPYVVSATDAFTLEGIDVRFSSTEDAPMIVGTDDYRLVGTTVSLRSTDAYVVNNEGTAFVPSSSTATIKPFRAYFTSTLPEGERLTEIPILADTEGISEPVTDSQTDSSVQKIYDLQGRTIINGKPNRGLYIVSGKKVIVK